MPENIPTFFCCYVEGSGGFNVCHSILEIAKQEAERLAQLPSNKGKRVFVLQAILSAKVPDPVTWESLRIDELPF
jgi:hypothetical protein